MKTLVIKIDGGLGRVIAMSGAITEIAKQRPVKVITSRPLVFRGNPFIQSVHGLDDRRLFEDVIKGNDYFELEPYTDPDFFNEGKNWLDVAAKQLGPTASISIRLSVTIIQTGPWYSMRAATSSTSTLWLKRKATTRIV